MALPSFLSGNRSSHKDVASEVLYKLDKRSSVVFTDVNTLLLVVSLLSDLTGEQSSHC